MDKSGNTYIYLLGVASTVAGDAVIYNGAFATARAVANLKGFVAFAMAAIVASKYGWYQISGLTNGLTLTAVVTAAPLYLTATAGQLDDAVVATDLVYGAFAYGTGGVGAACTFIIDNPFVTTNA
jgi:hypothetical protein